VFFLLLAISSVSVRKPGRIRQWVAQLKSQILFKIDTNVGFDE